jgi:hypothetical protein
MVLKMPILNRRQFLALASTIGAIAVVLAAGILWNNGDNRISPLETAKIPGILPSQENRWNPVIKSTAQAESNPTTAPTTSTPESSHESSTSTPASTILTNKTSQPTETVKYPPNHIARIRLEQAPGEFTAPEVMADLRSLTLDGQRIRIIDEQGSEISPIFYIQPRVWQGGDSISPVLESQSKEESRKHANTAKFISTDGTGHDSIIQRGDDSIVELHSWKSRTPDGRIILQPGELFKLILDGPDLVINQNGQPYAIASHTPEEIQHAIKQLTGQTFDLYQTDKKGKILRQMVQIKWIHIATPPTVTEYYMSGAMTVRQMLERDYGVIPKQQSGEKWLQFCTMRTADQPRETYGRGGAGHKPRLTDHEQTLTSVSIIPVVE